MYRFRTTYGDVAKRYIRWFGGYTEDDRIAIDDIQTFLHDKHGNMVARVKSGLFIEPPSVPYNDDYGEIPY